MRASSPRWTIKLSSLDKEQIMAGERQGRVRRSPSALTRWKAVPDMADLLEEKSPGGKGMTHVHTLDHTFVAEVMAEPGGEHLLTCWSCGTCAATCLVRRYESGL